MTLHIVPVRHAQARQFVAAWHRHNPPPPGAVFCLGVADTTGTLRGVAMVGRPVSRLIARDPLTLEVNRTATDGTANACSMLYAAAWRAARALGYQRLITYTQANESGASLRGAGWTVIGQRAPRAGHTGWNRPSRPRDGDSYLATARTLWEATA